MKPALNDKSVPVFEIDQPSIYRQYLLTNRLEILVFLRRLEKQRNIVSLYLDDGSRFFLSSIVALDETANLIWLDPASQSEMNPLVGKAGHVTLTASIDRVKIQMCLSHLVLGNVNGKSAFSAQLPDKLLRLQRREFFRVETPRINPLRCKLAIQQMGGQLHVFDFPLFDLSGGGLSLIGKVEDADQFSLGEIFHDCRLDIPGENVLSVNLRVCEVLKIETHNGEHQMRLGCEFISLPGTRLALIERYITRLERERKARESGLD